MTPPMKEKMKIDSSPSHLPRRVDGRYCLKGSGLLHFAQRVWAKGPRGNVTIPVWYSGQHGVPNRFLRKPTKGSTPKEKGLALTVRMNHILDYPHQYGVASRLHFYCLQARRIRALCRSIGPLYAGDGCGGFTATWCMNTSYTLAVDHDWKGALACTLRNFVHLVGVVKHPDVAFSQAFSNQWSADH